MYVGGERVKIAVVEDCLHDMERLKSCLKRYLSEKHLDFTIDTYGDSESFLAVAKRGYDIVFLDVELPKRSGLTAAREFRALDQRAELVLVTALRQYAINGYEVGARDFILKPVVFGDFAMRMERILSQLSPGENFLSLSTSYGFVRLDIRSIISVNIYGHRLVFRAANGSVALRGKLSEYEDFLQRHQFMRCSKSCLVNPRYIEKLEGQVLTVAGESCIVTRNRLQAFTDFFAAETIQEGGKASCSG